MAAPPSLGKYRLLAELGRGGMATVYLAAHTGPGGFQKLVVVKELHAELAQELEFRDMFLDEARIAARLSHPNIVQTFEVVEEGGLHLIVMEYLEGQPFSNTRARLAREQKLVLGDHVRVLADMLEGLHAAHEALDWSGKPLRVVHRDVSPHNVFVTYAGDVKVVDFGIAKAATSSQHTRTGVIKGKLSYMAPEQALGRPVDRRADIFAAGIMLWEAVASRRLWKEMPDPGIIHHLSTGEIPKVSDFVLKPDAILEGVCAKALAPDPEARYPTAAAMRADLEAFTDSQSPKPTARAFGELLQATFSKEREKIRQTIEKQMQSAESGNFELAKMDEQPAASSTSTSAATPQARDQPAERMTGSGALAVETGPRIPAEPAPSSRSRLAIAIVGGAAIAMILGTAIVLVVRSGGPKPGASTQLANTSPVPPSAGKEPSAVATPSDTAATSSAKPKPPTTTRTTATTKPTTVKPPPSLDINLSR